MNFDEFKVMIIQHVIGCWLIGDDNDKDKQNGFKCKSKAEEEEEN